MNSVISRFICVNSRFTQVGFHVLNHLILFGANNILLDLDATLNWGSKFFWKGLMITV